MWKVFSYLYHHHIKNLPVVNPFLLLNLPIPIFLNNAQKYSKNINCSLSCNPLELLTLYLTNIFLSIIMFNKYVNPMFMNFITGESNGKETTKRKTSKEFENISKR